ncbi:MAG: sulfite exporter TauE/SafE family protein, partial [Actinobacteria bacterium]|nr:sulfite exporter TauE/SafE family protein [Actinomycetota bacterium]
MSLEVIIFLVLASGFAGFVDSIAGGGGLIQLPSLLISMPNTAPSLLLGTNKLPSFLGTLGATASYLRKVKPDFKLAFVMAVPAFIGSGLGASVATKIPKEAFKPIILFMLIVVALYTWRKKELGLVENFRFARRHQVGMGALAGLVIGFYDGIFGPGTGSFLMLILVALLGFAFLQASVTAKIVNLATNLGAILVFGLNGKILWVLGLTMAIGNVIGGFLGARWALKGGSALIRKVFLVVTTLLILRLAYD